MKPIEVKKRFAKFDISSSGDIHLYEALLNNPKVTIQKEQIVQNQKLGTTFLFVWYVEKF